MASEMPNVETMVRDAAKDAERATGVSLSDIAKSHFGPGNGACCPSCGIAYVDHLGLIGTCKELTSLRSQLAAAEKGIKDAMKHQEIVSGNMVLSSVMYAILQRTLEQMQPKPEEVRGE